MPTYEYLCQQCQHTFEEFQSITAEPLKKCPKCGKLKLKRLIGTGAGIIFKGSGFYQTDYRSDSYTKAAKGESSPSSSSKSSAEAKTETKTETTVESKPETKPAEPKTTKTPAKKSA